MTYISPEQSFAFFLVCSLAWRLVAATQTVKCFIFKFLFVLTLLFWVSTLCVSTLETKKKKTTSKSESRLGTYSLVSTRADDESFRRQFALLALLYHLPRRQVNLPFATATRGDAGKPNEQEKIVIRKNYSN